MSVWLFIATCLVGALGAVSRFVVDGEIRRRWPSPLPWATFVVNVSGSLLLGLVTGAVIGHDSSNVLRVVVGSGFCGGYTTFGTAMVETLRLTQGRTTVAGVGYSVGTLVATVTAAGLGLVLA
ncbi:MAG: fluoride efflux transporter FluC [Janthinobacterium lividum]